MAIAKLTLRRKTAEELPDEQAEAPKKKLLKAAPAPVDEDEDTDEPVEEVPKKVLKKAKVVEAEVEEDEVEEEEEAPAPVKKVLMKKRLGAGPLAEEEPVEEEEEEEAPATAKKVLKKAAPVVEEDEEEEVEEAPKKKTLVAKKAAPVVEDDETDEHVDRAVVQYSPMALGQIDGEITDRDIQRPRIQMVQANSSDLEEKGFTIGQIALNGEVLIWDKGCEPINVILMTGRKKLVQKLSDAEYKEGVTPLVFDSAEKAREAGFRTEWQDDEAPDVDPALYALFLIEQPDYIEPDALFSLSFGERKFALAEMKLGGVNYRTRGAGANWLITQSRTSLAPDTRKFMLAMTASREKQKKSGNIVTVAQFKNRGPHQDQKFTEWVLSLG